MISYFIFGLRVTVGYELAVPVKMLLLLDDFVFVVHVPIEKHKVNSVLELNIVVLYKRLDLKLINVEN